MEYFLDSGLLNKSFVKYKNKDWIVLILEKILYYR